MHILLTSVSDIVKVTLHLLGNVQSEKLIFLNNKKFWLDRILQGMMVAYKHGKLAI